MSDPNVLGHFVWHELMTTDTNSAGAFYAKIAGWTTQPALHDSSYTTFISDGQAVAGLMVLPEQARQMGTPPNWLTYVATPDVDKTVQKSTGLGGKVLLPARDIPNVGRFAVLQDPQGAAFAVITMTQNPPVSDAMPPVGDFSWHELATTDAVAAWKFYSQLFGWKATDAMDMGPMGTYQMFGPMTRSVGGIYTKPTEMPGPAAWLPYIRAKDSRDVGARVPGLGGKIINGPMEVPGGDWIVAGMDPQGAAFATHSVTPAAAAKAPAAAPTKAGAAKKAARKAAKPAARKAAKPAARTTKKAKSKKTARPAARKKTAKKTAPVRRTATKKATRPAARTRSASKSRTRKAVKKAAAKK
jgi:predicted enzyme related to lactoylglutathione lyase